MNVKDANRLVEPVLAQWGSVTRRMVPIPDGMREVLVVGSDIVAVHPKAYVAFHRRDQQQTHGIRELLLKHYAANDYLLAFYEEDSRSILLGDPKALLPVSGVWGMPGAFEGNNEVSRFIPRNLLKLIGVAP